jgi:2-dehydro-3-deoxyphosphogluconate aldolase/(4S)-4-hydroxy-2-oxoglutarate aldolase
MTLELTPAEVQKRIAEIGIIPVVRAPNGDEAARAVELICEGGIPVAEITMTIPNPFAVIRQVVEKFGDRILVGAGTVLSAAQAEQCFDAGAQFLVSPGLSVPVLHAARARNRLAIPGTLTPTELMAALLEGVRLVKVFPCGNLGGAKYLKSLKGPFPEVLMVPTGGVNAGNAADYFAAGAFALGIGSDLVDNRAIREGNSQKVTAAARELVEAVKKARAAKPGVP